MDNLTMTLTDNIAANLSDWMASSPGLDTLKKVSARSGVGFGTVQRAKNGDGNPTITNLADIASAFGKPIEALLAEPKKDGVNVHKAAQNTATNQAKDPLQEDLAALDKFEAEAYTAKLDSLRAQIRSIEADIRSAANKARQEKTKDRDQGTRALDPPSEDRRTA